MSRKISKSDQPHVPVLGKLIAEMKLAPTPEAPMKPIPKVFRKDGITRTLVRRVGAVALYELTRPHWRQSFWEVMVIRRRAASRRPIPASGGSPARFVDCPASERLPATTEWGMAGWSLSTREQADRTFRKVLALRSEKEAISP